MNGKEVTMKVIAICISPRAGEPMQSVTEVLAIAGKGLQGDRYCNGEGSFSFKAKNFFQRWLKVKRQVTLINSEFFEGSGFTYLDSRRNIITEGVELMCLINKYFNIGGAIFRGVKYCAPCERPSKLCLRMGSFKKIFSDRGGLIAEVVQGGPIKVGDEIIPPPKSY